MAQETGNEAPPPGSRYAGAGLSSRSLDLGPDQRPDSSPAKARHRGLADQGSTAPGQQGEHRAAPAPHSSSLCGCSSPGPVSR